MIATTEKQLLSTFGFNKTLNENGHWLRDIRDRAIARFNELGFPTTKLEDWKYTNVSALAKIPFEAAAADGVILTREQLRGVFLAEAAFAENCNRLVFVNGHYSGELSSPDLCDQVIATSLAKAIHDESPSVRAHLARYAAYDLRAFVALNTAFIEDGAFIEVPAGAVIETPIHILYVSTSTEPAASHPRSLIVVGDRSQARIIESHVGLGDEIYMTNAVTEIIAGQNSVVEHYKLQDESHSAFHVSTVQVEQGRDSVVTSHSISLGGKLTRNDVTVVLNGEGAECSLNGLYITSERQHVDNHTVIDHAKPHGTSRELYKGILCDKSSAVFDGSIIVRTDAQKTDSRQSNKNLLLSEEATINSKPQLEINADDVKCAHGTSIGHPDEASIFYLRSRGIDQREAQALLTYGFANDVLDRMSIEGLRVRLECALIARLSHVAQTRSRE